MSEKITITETPYNFEIAFNYKPYIIKEIKRIPGNYFNGAKKVWIVPIGQRDMIHKFKIRFGIGKIDNRPEVYEEIPELPDMAPHHLERLLSLLKKPDGKTPFPYQLKGIARGLHFERFINADAPGLGKTFQSIGTIVVAEDALPCLIICPSSLKLNWQREIHMWTHYKAIIMTNSIKTTWPEYLRVGAAQFVIVNFESLKTYFVEKIVKPTPDTPLRLNHIHFKESINRFKAVIIDESHRVKELKTQQTKFTKGVAAGKRYIIELTGTPVVNKPRDLVSQLGIIDRLNAFKNYKDFIDRYCEGDNGAANLKELNYLLNKHCFYRREKKDVLKELPDKMRQIVLCDITTRKEYSDALTDLEGYLQKYKQATDEQIQKSMRGEIMVRIGILKNISARGKLTDVIEQIREVTEVEGEKLVIFCHLKEVAAALKAAFPDAVTVLGDDPTAIRQNNVDAFQNYPNVKLIICSIKAAGVGITLTASSRVGFLELPWHSADCDQCEDRCHRIGQHDSVQCMYFLGKDTIDEHIYKIIDKKRTIANTVAGTTETIETAVIDMMIGSLFNTRKNDNDIVPERDSDDEPGGEIEIANSQIARTAEPPKELFSDETY